jgi:SsrA-binding protein
MAKRRKNSGTSPTGEKVLATNRRAKFDYELGDHFEAGISLIGSEARSLRDSAPGINEAFIDVDRNGEAWVKQMRIAHMNHAAFGHAEVRPRKLLLHRSELDKIRAATERDGMTAVPTRMYYKNGRAKLEIALARGKKQYDKRETIKARTENREAQAAISRGRKDY